MAMAIDIYAINTERDTEIYFKVLCRYIDFCYVMLNAFKCILH